MFLVSFTNLGLFPVPRFLALDPHNVAFLEALAWQDYGKKPKILVTGAARILDWVVYKQPQIEGDYNHLMQGTAAVSPTLGEG